MRKNSDASRSQRSDKPSGYKKSDSRKPYGKKEGSFDKKDNAGKPYRKREEGEHREERPFGKKRENSGRFERKEGDFKKPYRSREEGGDAGSRKSYGPKKLERDGDKPSFRKRFEGGEERGEKRFEKKEGGFRKKFEDRGEGGFRKKSDGEDRGEKRFEKKEGGFKKKFEDRGEGGYRKKFDDNEGGEKRFDREKKFNKDDKFADRKASYKKSFEDRDSDEKPSRKKYEDGEGGEKHFEKREGGFRKKFEGDDKREKRFDKKDGKFAKKDAGKGGKKGKFGDNDGDSNKFGDQDIFEKKRRYKKEEDENYVANENEGFSKELTDKYATEKKPTKIKKKKNVEIEFDDDEDDYIDEREVKRNASKWGEVELEGPMTLNKYIAHSGQCSRRDAAELVKKGKVKVNGEMMLDPGYRVKPGDLVILGGKKLTPQKNMVYILLNKPKGFITTTEDPEGRKTVMELVENSGAERLFPVGRLDRNTTGLLLLTNDGDLAQKLSHPSHEIKKIYQVTLDKSLSKPDFDKITAGLELEDGEVKVDSIAYLDAKNEIGLEIHSGKNRIVRRIFESLGYEVEKLDRVMYAGLTKKNVNRGKWRFLTDREIILLKHFKN